MKFFLIKYCGLLILFSNTYFSVAQSLDSLIIIANRESTTLKKVDKLNELSINYKSSNYSTSKELALQAEIVAKTISYKDGEAIALRNQGIALTNLKNYDEALSLYTKALSLTKSKKIIGQLYGSMSRLYATQSEFVKALDYSYKSLTIFEEIKDLQLQFVSLYNIANLNLQMGSTEKYYDYKKRAEDLDLLMKQESIKTPQTTGPFLELKKENIQKKDTTHKKQSFFEIKIAEATKNSNLPELAQSLVAEGKIQTEDNNLEKGLDLLYSALKIERKLNNPYQIALIQFLLGNTEKKIFKKNKQQENLANAEKHYLNSLNYFKSKNLTIEEIDIYENLFELYELKGNSQKALHYHKLVYAKYQSLFNDKSKQTIKDLENKYQIEKKSKELKINQLKYQAVQKQKLYLFVIVSLLIISGALVYYQSLKRKKANAKLKKLNHELDEANKIKTRFFSILNHDLRSPVANLIHFLYLQRENPNLLDEATKKRFEQKTMQGAENLLSSMEDLLLWSKGQMENFSPTNQLVLIAHIYEDTKKIFSGYQNVSFNYLNEEDLSINTDPNYLKTIMRNLTSNAINAFVSANNATITWKAWQNQTHTFLSISDNGTGSTMDKFVALTDENETIASKNGLGLHLVRDMAKSINCELTVDSQIDKGTTITITFKNT